MQNDLRTPLVSIVHRWQPQQINDNQIVITEDQIKSRNATIESSSCRVLELGLRGGSLISAGLGQGLHCADLALLGQVGHPLQFLDGFGSFQLHQLWSTWFQKNL